MLCRRFPAAAVVVLLGATACGATANDDRSQDGDAAPSRSAPADPWDFDGDGDQELVVHAAFADMSPLHYFYNGSVVVFEGGPDGPGKKGPQRLDAKSGLLRKAEPNGYGESLSSGDFDADGYADLAGCLNSRVAISFGSPDGLQRAFVLKNEICEGASSGTEAGDVDGDGYDDLMTIGNYGSPAEDGPRWARGGPRASEPGTWKFVRVPGNTDTTRDLVGGDFDGDGHNDLLSIRSFLPVVVFQHLGGRDGFEKAQRFTPEVVEEAAAGDHDGDGYDDVALEQRDGSIGVWYGSPDGLDLERRPALTTRDAPVPGNCRAAEDDKGCDLATGDLDGDDMAELVIGLPSRDLDTVRDAGALVVIPGSSDGPDIANAQLVHQGTPGIPGSIEQKDNFGTAPVVRDTDGEGRPELAVGAPFEDNEQGRVYLLSNELEYLDRYVPSDAGLRPDGAWFGWRQ